MFYRPGRPCLVCPKVVSVHDNVFYYNIIIFNMFKLRLIFEPILSFKTSYCNKCTLQLKWPLMFEAFSFTAACPRSSACRGTNISAFSRYGTDHFTDIQVQRNHSTLIQHPFIQSHCMHSMMCRSWFGLKGTTDSLVFRVRIVGR